MALPPHVISLEIFDNLVKRLPVCNSEVLARFATDLMDYNNKQMNNSIIDMDKVWVREDFMRTGQFWMAGPERPDLAFGFLYGFSSRTIDMDSRSNINRHTI